MIICYTLPDICYTLPEIWCVTNVILIFHFGLFFAILPPDSPKNEKLKRMKKLSGGIIILHNCTKNQDHILYYSEIWHMMDVIVIFHFGLFFALSPWGFNWGRQLAIFADHWTTNALKVAGYKSITIIYFFLSEIIFRERIAALSNNDRFDNYKIFLRNIWHFSVITRINCFYFFHIYLKDTWKNFVVNKWTIHNSYCEVQSVM